MAIWLQRQRNQPKLLYVLSGEKKIFLSPSIFTRCLISEHKVNFGSLERPDLFQIIRSTSRKSSMLMVKMTLMIIKNKIIEMVIGDFGICENVKFTNRRIFNFNGIRSSLYGSSYQHRELDFVVNEFLPNQIGLGSVLGTKLLPDFDSARRGEDSIYYCSLFLEEVMKKKKLKRKRGNRKRGTPWRAKASIRSFFDRV
uniref:Uncharacterized protein n=1 Tax=Rhizophagus irregularis (strain DAOM 181602 / DAOM 197198 / MUCL 43194) TaxID=747089 RepID=U9SYL4_RHIID